MATKQHPIPDKQAKPVIIRRSKKSVPVKLLPAPSAKAPSVAALRKEFGLNRKLFARLTSYSERAVAKWEGGAVLSGTGLQKMNEMRRLHQALTKVIKPDFVPQWLQTPSGAFGGLKPIEVVERGEVDRIWRMIYSLESGTPG